MQIIKTTFWVWGISNAQLVHECFPFITYE